MKLENLIVRIKNRTDSIVTQDSIDDLQKLVDNYDDTFINSRLKLIIRQVELGITNHYNRIKYLHENYGKDSSSLKACQIRYGTKEGKRFYEEKRKKTTINLERFVTKYGETEGVKRHELYKKSKSKSLENYIRRHGEEQGRLKYEEYWRTTNFRTSKEAFIRRHGEIQGPILYEEFRLKQAFNSSKEGVVKTQGKAAWEKKTKRAQ